MNTATRGPGRPRRQDPKVASDLNDIPESELAPGLRRRNIGEFGKDVLGFKGEKEEGFTYRIVNDEKGRVQQMLENGWQLVENGGQLGDSEVGKGSTLGSQVRRTVNRSNGVEGVLMRIRTDWYEQYQRAKQARVGETIKALSGTVGGKSEGYYSPNSDGTAIKIGN